MGGRPVGSVGRSASATPVFCMFLIFIGKSIFHFFHFLFFLKNIGKFNFSGKSLSTQGWGNLSLAVENSLKITKRIVIYILQCQMQRGVRELYVKVNESF